MATTYQNPTNGDSVPPQQTDLNETSRTPSNRRQHYPTHMNYSDDRIPRDPNVSRTHSVSYKSNPLAVHGGNSSRSFAARTKELNQENMEWIDKPLLSNSPDMPDRPAASQRNLADPGPSAPNSSRQREDSRKMAPYLESGSQTSPLSRSSTLRSSVDQRHDWASDRSPLQKLEVTLKGISKEEKRARVLEAEMRLKERLARQKREADAHPSAPSHPQDGPSHGKLETVISTSQRTIPEREIKHEQPTIPRQQAVQETNQQASHEGSNSHGEQARSGRSRAPSLPYATVVRPVQDPQYSNAKAPAVQIVNMGTAPRRSVSVSHRPEGYSMDPPPANPSQGNRTHNRSASQALPPPGPSKIAAPKQTNAQTLRQPPYPNSGLQQNKQVPQLVQEKVPSTTGIVAPPGPPSSGSNIANDTADKGLAVFGNIQNGSGSQNRPKNVSFDVPPSTPPPVSEWKNASVARLEVSDFDFNAFDADRSKAWWEGGGSDNRRKSRALPKNYQKPAQKPTVNKSFQPPLFLKCGPLLRYTGLKRVQIDGPNGPFDKETWRGSILIVTKDSRSSYETPPTVRLFSQPMDLLPPPPVEVSGAQLAPEYVDPTAGLMKLGRDGRPLYVKPVDHTEEELDLSFVENDEGIYEMSASIMDYGSDGIKQPVPANRLHPVDGETAGTYKEVAGARLYADAERDVTFWRFNLEIELGQTQQRIAYRLNQGPALGFWVPARDQPMNIMFYTCNGFSQGVDTNKFCGPDPLWRDVLNEHQTRPFHVMIGGGDQIFNDKVTAESRHFQEWVKIKNLNEKYDTPFDPEFRAELESSFLEHYSRWFSQGLFSLVNSYIPMVNIWNDHEIIEGFGSYPDEFMSTAVISGLGRIAFKYYLLFQHHSVPEETEAEEPSWLLGAHPGPYIGQKSRNLFMSMGKEVAFLGLDCRTERMSDEILSEQTCDLIWDRCHREIVRGETKHLIVVSSIPLAYPRMAMLKNILNSRKSLGKAGLFGGFVNKNGSKIEIFDDHWTGKLHKSERTFLVEDLQDLAAEKSVRVTILSGDVHMAAIGQFYSNLKLNLPKDKDYRYIPNIISSAIADIPETEMVSDLLNRRNRVHHLDTNTDEDMIPIFTHDVDHKPRNNKRLLPRRNWCSIRGYQPDPTPPAVPESKQDLPIEVPRPAKLQRTLSLGRGDKPQGGLLRRLSGRGRPPTKEFNLGGTPARRMSMDGPFPPAETGDSSFPPPPDFQPGPFHLRPTSLSRKAAKQAAKTGDDGVGSYVNLEGGLAITLNLELNPKDPSGITTPYKLLVPALRYQGNEYDPPANPVAKGWKKWLRVRRKKENNYVEDGASDEEDAEHDNHGDYEEAAEEYPKTPVPVDQAPAGGPDNDGETTKRKKRWFGRRLG